MNRRARYGWMALGGLMCLFGVVAMCKWRDSSRAYAQAGPILPPVHAKSDEPRPLPPVAAEALPRIPPPDIIPASANVPAPPAPVPAPVPPPPPAVPTPPLGSDPRPIMIPPTSPVPPPPAVTVPASVPPPSVPVTPPVAPTPPPMDYKPVDPPAPPPVTPVKGEIKDHPDEPPLAPAPGPMITYRLTRNGETFRTLSKKTLGTQERWNEIHKLNPTIRGDATLVAGTLVRLPADACIQDEAESVRALPALRARPAPKAKTVLPLTGTFPLTLDDNKGLTLPQAILNQFGNCDTVLVSPGSDKCLWLTNQAHLDRLAAKLDKSPARESDIRTFKRLYYAQVTKAPVKDGRIVLSEKLAQFAELHQEVVLVGIDDHFEVWDAAKWRRYTQAKKALDAED